MLRVFGEDEVGNSDDDAGEVVMMVFGLRLVVGVSGTGEGGRAVGIDMRVGLIVPVVVGEVTFSEPPCVGERVDGMTGDIMVKVGDVVP
jgi:hypothetical protein